MVPARAPVLWTQTVAYGHPATLVSVRPFPPIMPTQRVRSGSFPNPIVLPY
jgi:hypothetical protein